MTRHLRAVGDAPDPGQRYDCLLCGQDAETYADLCDHCARIVQSVADRVADRVLAGGLPSITQVPGQLTMDDDA